MAGTLLKIACNICGGVGFSDLMISCSTCGIVCQHLYCFPVLKKKFPDNWVCEECQVVQDASLGHRMKKDSENWGGSNKVCHNFVAPSHHKNQKPIRTGKVKFLPAEEVIRLPSGSEKKTSLSITNPGNRHDHSSKMQKFPPPNFKRNVQAIYSGAFKHPGRGRMQTAPIFNGQAGRATKEQKAAPAMEYGCKEQQLPSLNPFGEVERNKMLKHPAEDAIASHNTAAKVEANKTFKQPPEEAIASLGPVSEAESSTPLKQLTKEAIASLSPAVAVKTDQTLKQPIEEAIASLDSVLQVKTNQVLKQATEEASDPLDSLPKFLLYSQHLPALGVMWRGTFECSDAAATVKFFYGGFQAQLPCRVHRKAYGFSKMMPPILEVKLLPLGVVLEGVFQGDHPDFQDIGIYFFPSADFSRLKENYFNLFELLESHSSAGLACIDGVELLIFTSKQLESGSQDAIARSSIDHFLWGVFRHTKDDRLATMLREEPSMFSSKSDYQTNADMGCSEAIDMEIGMVGEDFVVREASSKIISEEFEKENVDKNTPTKSENNIMKTSEDMFSAIDKILLQSRKNHQNITNRLSKVAQGMSDSMASGNSSQSSDRKLNCTSEVDVPPGFEEKLKLRKEICGATLKE